MRRHRLAGLRRLREALTKEESERFRNGPVCKIGAACACVTNKVCVITGKGTPRGAPPALHVAPGAGPRPGMETSRHRQVGEGDEADDHGEWVNGPA